MDSFVTREENIKAEIWWTLKVIKEHWSYNSCSDVSSLFKLMWPNIEAVSQFSCGEKKAMYLACYGLSPYFLSLLVKRANSQNAIVLMFDEAFNSCTQSKQMDVYIRLWSSDMRVTSRYLGSTFMGHGTATDILEHFKTCTEKLNFKNVFQISMDGPNVNWAFHEKLQQHIKEEFDCQIMNIGSCGLHVMHGAFKHGCTASEWQIDSFLKSIYTLFHETPARREDFEKKTASVIFPKKYCQHRWLENVPVVERALEFLPNLKKYVEAVKKKELPKPETVSFARIVEALKDPLLEAKLHSFLSVARTLQPFLTLYQTDHPMIPFIADDLHKLLKNLMGRFLQSSAVQGVSLVKLVDINVGDNNLHLNSSKVDIGFTADLLVKDLLYNKTINERAALQFRMECKAFLLEVVKRLLLKAPVKYGLVRNLSCLKPSTMASDPESCKKKMKFALQKLALSKKVKEQDCDVILQEFSDFLHDEVILNREKFNQFDHSNAECRIDTFLHSFMAEKQGYQHLWNVVQNLLLLSHGQAAVERGFSINKEMVTTNLAEKTLVAQRIVHDHCRSIGGYQSVDINKDLLQSCAASRRRYQAHLDEISNSKKNEEVDRKRKICLDEIVELKEKRQRLEVDIKDLVLSANDFSKKAEEQKQFSLLTKANALRDASLAKEKQLTELVSILNEKVKALS